MKLRNLLCRIYCQSVLIICLFAIGVWIANFIWAMSLIDRRRWSNTVGDMGDTMLIVMLGDVGVGVLLWFVVFMRFGECPEYLHWVVLLMVVALIAFFLALPAIHVP